MRWAGIKARYGVGVPAGGLGATVSVLTRMTSQRMRLNYETQPRLLSAYGALRPAIGAVFGMVVFALIAGGLVPALAVPTDQGTLVSFYAVFGFLAGFNERFAQDMLAGAASVLPDPGRRQTRAGRGRKAGLASGDRQRTRTSVQAQQSQADDQGKVETEAVAGDETGNS